MKPKFRVWDIEQSTMVTEDDLLTIKFCRDEIYVEIDDYLVYEIYEIEPFELMQSTGLKDKNGTEIYEGDILKWKGFLGHGWQATIHGFISYEKEEARFRLTEDVNQDYADLYLTSKIGEVVGNIYEHSHLLEGDNHASN